MRARWRNGAASNCGISAAPAASTTGFGTSRNRNPDRWRRRSPALRSGALAGHVFLPLFTPGGPILLHPVRNFLAFLGVHELSAAALGGFAYSRNNTGASLQFLQRGDHALESLFLGV